MKPGDKNAYCCPECQGTIVTIDRDDGTTPLLLGCRATLSCRGMMESMMYRLPEDLADVEPTHEWYKPSDKWARRHSPEMQSHVKRGGLVLREIKKREA